MAQIRKTPKCKICGKRYPLDYPTPEDVPVMVGFLLNDGSVLNYCFKCLEHMGREREKLQKIDKNCPGNCDTCEGCFIDDPFNGSDLPDEI